jgi:hypothetical protein
LSDFNVDGTITKMVVIDPDIGDGAAAYRLRKQYLKHTDCSPNEMGKTVVRQYYKSGQDLIVCTAPSKLIYPQA